MQHGTRIIAYKFPLLISKHKIKQALWPRSSPDLTHQYQLYLSSHFISSPCRPSQATPLYTPHLPSPNLCPAPASAPPSASQSQTTSSLLVGAGISGTAPIVAKSLVPIALSISSCPNPASQSQTAMGL